MNLVTTLALTYTALTCLAMASGRYRHGAARPTAHPARLRATGWLLLAIAAAPAWTGWGPSVGLSLWTASIGFAAFCCTLLISFRPDWVPRGGAVALAAGLAAWTLG